ncbi:hypothetical protein [Sulfurovum mangrovi]|uniref:hypothetical protein n=1 Tax=Sulfurovum mangrovi TaxID=2893889 RepID=UPI001E294162|nr:hypothetical protein [Sulfurovum mangrovi]UFH59574.1 hypothetical protein LN246_01685 [Sulfurovum mangrovi]UFH60714.1 hypothetical protein LN246_14230 [Sulfurovum mangrovi]
MKKDTLFWIWAVLLGMLLLLGILFTIEESRTFLVALLIRLFIFTKHHLIAILSAFFLVKGKFIFALFIKKIALLSATGLGKRYFIEKVLTHHIKIHFLDHVKDDFLRLGHYVKNNFKKFPIIKQFIATIAFLGSLGFVGKFMGWMLAIKVFVAKFWSFLLAIFLKSATAVGYFFTDYLWGSWIAPVVEVVIFSWLLEWLEKIPFLKGFFQSFYRDLQRALKGVEKWIERLFHIPLRAFFSYVAKWVKQWIDRFIGEERLSSWYMLQKIQALKPSSYEKLKKRREERKREKKGYLSAYERLKEKRLNRAQ